MNKTRVYIKIWTGITMLILGLSLSCMLSSAHEKDGLRDRSEQELNRIISKNDKVYNARSEKQMKLNKAYKEKISRLRQDESYGMSRQKLNQINSKMDHVNENVTRLSGARDRVAASKARISNQDPPEKRKNDKIRVIQKQRKCNRILTSINQDLEEVVDMLG